MEFDFIDHQLIIETSEDESRICSHLEPRSVADFYREFMAALHSLDIDVKIWPMPVEVPESDSIRSGYARTSRTIPSMLNDSGGFW